MNRPRLLAFNALSMLAASIVSKIVLFLGYVYLLQYLDAGLESIFYLVTAFAAVICIGFQDGMVSVTIRKIATDLENGPRHLGTCYLASFLLAIFLGAIAIPASLLYARTQFVGSGLQGEFILSACALTGALLVSYGYATAGTGFKAYERLYLEAILLVFSSLLNAGVFWYGSVHRWPLSSFFLALLATSIIQTIVSNLVLFVFVVKPRFHTDIDEAWSLFREAIGLGFATLLRTLQDRMHPFFIKGLVGREFVTQFSSPNNMLVQLKFVPMSIRPALFPTLARKAELPTEAFQVYSLALMKFLYLLALPILIILAVSRYEVLPLVTSFADPYFSERYAMALGVMPLVAWTIALSFPSQVLRSLFVSLKKPEFEFRSVLAGVIVLVVLDLILIPRINVMGCGYAAIAAEVTILGYGLWLLRSVGRGLKVMNLFFLPTLCGMIVHLLAEWLYGHHWAYGILGVLVLFPILVLGLRVISPAEWAIMRDLIRPANNAANQAK